MTSPNRNSPSPSGLYLSLFHPVVPDRAQMRRYVKLAEEYQADGFEICGDAHGWRQGLDGVLLFEEYPRISRKRDRAEVLKLRRSLNEVVSLAHAAKKPVLYWHREVVLPQDLSSFLPELFDENGEIDYNKPEFFDLLRYKIDRFFQAVPAMDGIVLTLTEADFAVIHNSDPKRYPPEQVAAKIIATFAGEIQRRGKLFSLRTFGSIAADHAILTSAAQKAAEETRYEISAKITPYDWSLYAELNPQLTRLSNTSLAAEFDMLGEFFGLGEIPCLYPERIVQQVREARRAECVRVAPRCDRDERWIMDSVNGLNLFALCRTWRDDRITADEIWAEWANAHWGIAGKDLIPLMKKSEAMVKKSFYIDHHMVSQIATPDWEYMALGGIFAVFQENISLSLAKDL